MAPKKKKGRDSPPLQRPRNTVTLLLDGDESLFVTRYLSCQAHLQYWMLLNSGFRVRYGDQIVFTTPFEGTFYYVLRYEGRFVVFVIVARTAWLIGFVNLHGFFQMREDDIIDLYMDSEHTEVLHFDGNHKSISPNGTGSFIVNLDIVRKRFLVLCNYMGPKPSQDPMHLRSDIGFFVVFLMEAKSKVICQRHCNAILGETEIRLDDWVCLAITNWSSVSQQVLWTFDDLTHIPHDCGIEVIKHFDQLLGVFYYLHVDGHFRGMFKHKEQEEAPRRLIWEPVDKGRGDGDIMVKREQVPVSSTSLMTRGARKRVAPEIPLEERRSKKPRGLVGGGLGGEPASPEVFRTWTQSSNDGKACDALVAHIALFGLVVRQAKRRPGHYDVTPLVKSVHEGIQSIVLHGNCRPAHSTLERNGAQTADTPTSSSNNSTPKPKTVIGSSKRGLTDLDIDSLAPGRYVTDPIITKEFENLRAMLEAKGIHDVQLLDPMVSYLAYSSGDFSAVNFLASRLVLIPLNNNKLYNRADGGTHWSLLVVDQLTQEGPRVLHYDSFGQCNHEIAQEVARQLYPYLPHETKDLIEEETPQQERGSTDCAIFVISIAKSISQWCFSATAADEGDWKSTIHTKVGARSVSKMRKALRKKYRRYRE